MFVISSLRNLTASCRQVLVSCECTILYGLSLIIRLTKYEAEKIGVCI